MTRREALQTEAMLERLTALLDEELELSDKASENAAANDVSYYDIARKDAESLRRISMTLHRWHELECGVNGGCIERDELGLNGPKNTPYWVDHNGLKARWHKIPDREAGALKRLAAIMARYPSLSSYVQSDPRGCALYVLRPGDVPAGERPESYYSRGLAVHQ